MEDTVEIDTSVKIRARRDGGIGRRVSLRIPRFPYAPKRIIPQVAETSRADALDLRINDAPHGTKIVSAVCQLESLAASGWGPSKGKRDEKVMPLTYLGTACHRLVFSMKDNFELVVRPPAHWRTLCLGLESSVSGFRS